MPSLELIRALNRFGLGARPGDTTDPTIANDPRGWLRSQVNAANLPVWPSLTLELGLKDTSFLWNEYQTFKQAGTSNSERLAYGKSVLETEETAWWRQSLGTSTPFIERWVHFWTNHFAVSLLDGLDVGVQVGAYSRDAIRPNVLGKFKDMVLASAKHPCMLIYLDNNTSIGPNSRRGSRGNNENYARELLELHTVGVDGGYTLTDIQQLSLMLTGWSVGGPYYGQKAPFVPFRFYPDHHEPGDKVIMGQLIEEDLTGTTEGEKAIEFLASHPNTATFIATKLVKFFVNDYPNPADVAMIANVFNATDGDLGQVALALIDLDSVYKAENWKFRTPQDWFLASARALNMTEPQKNWNTYLPYQNHRLWSPATPQGYLDGIRNWAGPANLLERIERAKWNSNLTYSNGTTAQMLASEVVEPDMDKVPKLLANIMEQSTERYAMAVLMASPNFQWR